MASNLKHCRITAKVIDFRSDTFSLPTEGMKKAMYRAQVGDDVYSEDPSVNALEARCALMMGKEAALYVPTGTMSNLVSVLTHCNERGSEVITGHLSHITMFEQTGAAQFGGINIREVQNKEDGTFDLNELKTRIRGGSIHEPVTKLICVENTHNVLGGVALPMEWIDQLVSLAKSKNIGLHLDGARIFNASIAVGVPVDRIARDFDSVSFCFSKGLGAPFGAVVVSSAEFIRRARKIRKGLGGGCRQIGFMAAASNYALDHMEHLFEDHQNTKRVAQAIREVQNPYVSVPEENGIHSNILIITVDSQKLTSYDLVKKFEQVHEDDPHAISVKTLPFGEDKVRITLCINNKQCDVEEAIVKIKSVLKTLEL